MGTHDIPRCTPRCLKLKLCRGVQSALSARTTILQTTTNGSTAIVGRSVQSVLSTIWTTTNRRVTILQMMTNASTTTLGTTIARTTTTVVMNGWATAEREPQIRCGKSQHA